MSESISLPIAGAVGSIDIVGLTETTTPADNDFVLMYDESIKEYRKIQRSNLTSASPLIDSINDLTFAGDEMIYTVSSSAFSKSSVSSYIRTNFFPATTQAQIRAGLALTPGVDVQAWSAALDSITSGAAVAVDNEILYFASNILARATMSTYVRDTVLPVADAASLATAISAVSFDTATDNRMVKFDGTDGKIQNSGITIDDSNNLTGIGTITSSGAINGVSTAIMSELANIGAATISGTQWGYLGALNQTLITTADADFNTVTLVGALSAAGGSLTAALNMNSNKITNLAAPTVSGDAATKSYVDALAGSGLEALTEAEVSSTANVAYTYNNTGGTNSRGSLTAPSNGAIVIDGYSSLIVGARVLIKDQSTALQNGVYVVDVVGTAGTPYVLERAIDFYPGVDPITNGKFILIQNGTTHAGTGWILQSDVTTVGTDAVDFVQYSAQLSAGTGLESSGGALNVVTVGTSGNIYVNGSNQVDINGALSVTKGGTGNAALTNGEVVQMNAGGTAFESTGLTSTTIASLSGTQSLTNKTLDSTTNTVTADALWDKVGSKISINNTASALNQVLKMTSLAPLQAEWAAQEQTVDINGLAAITSTENTDELILYDDSNTANRKITVANFAANIPVALPSGVTIVAASNGDYTTIGAAMTAVPAGSTILVYPGTYAESITYTKNLRIIGYPAALNVIISGADTTSTRVTFSSAITSATFREITVVTPSSGTNYAIDCNATLAGTLSVIYNVVIQGGGAGHGVRASAAGITATIGGFYHNGGTLGDFLQVNGGTMIVQNCIVNVGSATNVFNITGGVCHMNSLQANISALYSATDCFDISGGELEVSDMVVPDNSPFTNYLHISGENVIISMSSTHLHASTYHILIDGGLTGTGSKLSLNCEFDIEKVSFPFVWGSNATVNVLHVDQGVFDDSGIKVAGGGFVVGHPALPTETVMGEGDSTTVDMVVFTSTDVTDIAGATYVDVTSDAKTNSGSTFTVFPAVTNGSGLFMGNTTRKFYGAKIEIDTGITYGSGIVSFWYYNGTIWKEVNFMFTKSSSPYTSYANAGMTNAEGQQVRLDYDAMNVDWATISVNGTTAYWIYMRVGRDLADSTYPNQLPANTNSITTAPIFERMKLHVNRTEVNGDGVIEFFGCGQPQKSFQISEKLELSGTPSNATGMNISTNIDSVDIINARLDAIGEAHGHIFVIPTEVDTSRKITIIVHWLVRNNSSGNVELITRIAQPIAAGTNIVGGTVPEESQTIVQAVNTNNGDIFVSTFDFIFPSTLPTNLAVVGIERGINTTYVGNLDIFNIDVKCYTWRI